MRVLLWTTVALIGCANSDPGTARSPSEGSEAQQLVWGETQHLTVSLTTYSDSGTGWVTVNGRLGLMARHLEDDRIDVHMLDGEVIPGPPARDEFYAFSGPYGPAVVLTRGETGTEAWTLDEGGFTQNAVAPPFGRWGGLTDGWMVGELDDLMAFELTTGAEKPLRQPADVQWATAPIAGHGLYVDHRLGDMFAYDLATGTWDLYGLPVDVHGLASKAFADPNRVVMHAARGEETVFAVVPLDGSEVDVLSVPPDRPGRALWTVGDDMVWIDSEMAGGVATIDVTEVDLAR